MMETLLSDYSRRGLLDGRIVRLPTVSSPFPIRKKTFQRLDDS